MTNVFLGKPSSPLLMPISQGWIGRSAAMLIRRRRRYNFNIEQETDRSTEAAEHRTGALCSLSLSGTRDFSGKKPRDHAHRRSAQMRKGRNRANSDLLFVSADDLEKNPEHEDEPRWQPNPAKIIKVTPQKADFRLRKCQGVKRDQTGHSAAGTDTGNGGSRGRCNVQEIPNESGKRDQCDIAQRTQKIFHVIAKNEKEIHVADEMNDSGMKKK